MAGQFDFYRSTSQRRAYRKCPKSAFLKYGLKWKSKTLRATYVFGTVMQACLHVAIEQRAFGNQTADPQDVFLWLWEALKLATPGAVFYPQKRDWKAFRDLGVKLIVACFDEIVATLDFSRPIFGRHPFLLEPDIRYQVGSTEERVIPDYIGWARVPGKVLGFVDDSLHVVPVVIDWKTGDRDKDVLAATLDEQLTSEQLGAASRGIEVAAVGLVTLVYQQTAPRVQWLWKPARTARQLDEFRNTCEAIDTLMKQGVFYENDQACNEFGGCDFRPLCYPELRDTIGATLEQDIRYAPGSTDGLFDDV